MIKKLSAIILFILFVTGCSDSNNTNISINNTADEVYIKITFDGNGAESGSMQSMQAVKGSTVILSENKFVKNGYIFSGWSETLNGEVKYSDKASIKADKDITLYAVWNIIETSDTFKVTLYSNYDDNITIKYFKKGSTYILPNTPYLNGSKGFLGWSSSKNGTVEYVNQQSIQVQKNLDLYAVWTEDNPKESYSININNQSSYNCGDINEQIIYGGSLYLDYKQCERNDYVFLGWAETGSNKVIYRDGDVITVTRDLSLEPVWIKADDAYAVTFNTGQGWGVYGSPKVVYAQKGDGIILPSSDYFKRDNFVPAGYSSVSDSDDNYMKPIQQFFPESDTVMYVVWKDGSNKEYAGKTRWIYGVSESDIIWDSDDKNHAFWSENANWYDIYQFNSNLCWSASASNMLLWWYKNNKAYVDKYNSQIGNTLPEFIYNTDGTSPIFEVFRRNMPNEGSKPTIALNYFILGSSIFNEGAYFKEVFNNNILAETHLIEDKAKFNNLMNEIFTEKKSASIEVFTTGEHVVTFWGASYDNEGFINKLYVTDSATDNIHTNDDLWGDLVTADIIYKDNQVYIKYSTYADYKIPNIHSFSLGQDIWELYFNNIK